MANEKSEWGRLNAGQVYGLLAVDIDRALACAGLSEHEQTLVQAVRERSWGTSARRKEKGQPWPDATPCQIDLMKLAKEVGVAHQRFYEVRSRLVKSRILLLSRDGLMLNKDAHEWLDSQGTGPRLSPAKLVYSASARTRNRNNPHPPDFTVERESDPQKFTVEREEDSRLNVKAIHGQTLKTFTVEREGDSRLNVNGPYRERARDSDLNLDSESNSDSSPPHTHSENPASGDATPSICVGGESAGSILDRNGELMGTSGQVQNDPAEVHRVARLADDLFPDSGFSQQVACYQSLWPMAWVERALIDARSWRNPPRSFQPIVNILRAWQQAGGPPAVAPPTGTNGQVPTPRAAPTQAELRRRELRESLKSFGALFAQDEQK